MHSDAQMIMEDMKRAISELEQESALPAVGVELVDNEVATLYMNSKKSEVRTILAAHRVKRHSHGFRISTHITNVSSVFCVQADFRDYPPLLRQAVSVARKIQDPLMEYAQVCSTDEDILCLKLHPLQVRLKIGLQPFPIFTGVKFAIVGVFFVSNWDSTRSSSHLS